MLRWASVIFALASAAVAQPAIRTRVESFTTSSSVFVEVPNSRLSAPLSGSELGLLLWHANLQSTASGSSTAELIIEPPDGGNRWGFIEAGDVAPGAAQLFRNFDWDVGTPVDLVARVRSNVPDASVTVRAFEALFLPLGPDSEVLREERYGNVVVQSGQWTDLGTVTIHRASRQWLVLAQANVAATTDAGVTLRVRRTNSADATVFPPPLDNSSRSGALFTRERMGAFFLAQHLATPAPGDTVTLEAFSAPGFTDGGLQSVLNDVRLIVVPVLQLDQTATTPGVLTLTPTAAGAQISTTSNPGTRYTLSVYSTLAAGADGGLSSFWQSGTRGVSQVWPAIAGVEQPVLSDWAFEPQGTALTSSVFVRTLTGLGSASQPTLSLWKWDGGVIELPQEASDAGAVVDAGVDAGSLVDAGALVDAGSLVDAGALVDAGVDAGSLVDAGALVDAGLDAGSLIDAGAVVDAGSVIDAGLEITDAGTTPSRKTFALGCSSTGELGWFALLLLRRRRI